MKIPKNKISTSMHP